MDVACELSCWCLPKTTCPKTLWTYENLHPEFPQRAKYDPKTAFNFFISLSDWKCASSQPPHSKCHCVYIFFTMVLPLDETLWILLEQNVLTFIELKIFFSKDYVSPMMFKTDTVNLFFCWWVARAKFSISFLRTPWNHAMIRGSFSDKSITLWCLVFTFSLWIFGERFDGRFETLKIPPWN